MASREVVSSPENEVDSTAAPGLEESQEPVLYAERVFDREELSAESLEEELASMNGPASVYISPAAFATLLESKAGQHQTELYDMSDEERRENESISEFVQEGIKEVADILSGLPADSGRIDVQLYERDGDPRYLRLHEGEVSDQVFHEFERNFALDSDYSVEPTRNGYALEF